jgi:hypothetical protein
MGTGPSLDAAVARLIGAVNPAAHRDMPGRRAPRVAVNGRIDARMGSGIPVETFVRQDESRLSALSSINLSSRL